MAAAATAAAGLIISFDTVKHVEKQIEPFLSRACRDESHKKAMRGEREFMKGGHGYDEACGARLFYLVVPYLSDRC